MDIPADMLGRVVNPLASLLMDLVPFTRQLLLSSRLPVSCSKVFQPASRAVQTGLLAIEGDFCRPWSVLIGDRGIAIAIDATTPICFCICHRRRLAVANIRESLSRHGVLDKTVIAATAAAMQYSPGARRSSL